MLRTTRPENTEPAPWLDVVFQQVSDLRFGFVQIVVHDGRVVQIEKTEKVRIDKPDNHET